MSWAYCLNSAWMLKCYRELLAFRRATGNVESAQAAILREILHTNRHTDFGRGRGFGSIASPQDFRARVPLSKYDDYRDFDRPHWSRRAERAHARTRATAGADQRFEVGGEKWIPYTDALRRQFQRGVAAWIANLYLGRPAVRRGRAYWSISPALGHAGTNRGRDPDWL